MSNSTHLVPSQSGDINILYDTHYLIHVELSLRNENLDLLKTQKFTGLGLRGRTSDHREDCLPNDGCSGWVHTGLDIYVFTTPNFIKRSSVVENFPKKL